MKRFISIIVFVASGFFAFIILAKTTEAKKPSAEYLSGDDYQKLIDLADKNPELLNFLNEASKTKWTDLTLQPPEPENLKAQDEKGLPSKEWTQWVLANQMKLSLKEIENVKKSIIAIPAGTIVFMKPDDTPLQYDRSFFTAEYKDGKITKILPWSLQ